MKKVLFLHIGSPKTGTTSIQEHLGIHSQKYLRDGYLIPCTSRKNNYNHICLTNYALDLKKYSRLRLVCNTNSEKEIVAFRKKFYKSLRKEILDFKGKYIILSNEHCYKKLHRQDEILRLKQLFDGLVEEVKIIVYIREQSDMLCSRYSTSVKNNDQQKISSIEDYAIQNHLNYNLRLKKWEDVFGIENIVLRVFDREKLYQNNVVSDFCKTLNLLVYDSNLTNLNTSLNAKQCEFLRIVNIHMPDLSNKDGFTIRHQLNTMVSNTRIESPPVSSLINKDYQAIYDESNRELALRYFGPGYTLFNKKSLNDFSLDQEFLLSENDKKYLAKQIIESNHHLPELCKCIAAIFDVDYQGSKIPLDFVRNFSLSKYSKISISKISHNKFLLKKSLKRLLNGIGESK